MNKTRLMALAKWLEGGAQHPHIRFDMSTYIQLLDKDNNQLSLTGSKLEDICSTTCCMAGVLVQTYAGEILVNRAEGTVNAYVWCRTLAAEIAGLTHEQARALFIPDIALYQVTPKLAAMVVRHLIKTGEVDWRVAGFTNAGF